MCIHQGGDIYTAFHEGPLFRRPSMANGVVEMVRKTFVWAFFATAIAFASTASADNPCAADQEKFCSPSKLGGEASVLKCMDEHFDELSPDCKAAIEKVREGIKAKESGKAPKAGGFRAACRADTQKLCKDSIGKPAKLKACLTENESKLSDECKTALKAANEKAKAD